MTLTLTLTMTLCRWLTKPIVWGTIVTFLLVLFFGAIWAWLNTVGERCMGVWV